MAKDFVKLSEVPVLETASDNATVLIEENGEIKRVPKKEVGGGGAIATAIIRSSDYLDTIEAMKNGGASEADADETTFECLNMTFEEAYQIMESGEPLMVIGMLRARGATCLVGESEFAGTVLGVPCIVVQFFNIVPSLFWTADGISTENSGGGPS